MSVWDNNVRTHSVSVANPSPRRSGDASPAKAAKAAKATASSSSVAPEASSRPVAVLSGEVENDPVIATVFHADGTVKREKTRGLRQSKRSTSRSRSKGGHRTKRSSTRGLSISSAAAGASSPSGDDYTPPSTPQGQWQ